MITYYKYIKKVGWPIVLLLILFLLDPFELGYIAGYLIIPIIYTRRTIIERFLDFDYFLLLIFSAVYALFYILGSGDILIQTFLFYLFFPPAFYLLGKYFVAKADNPGQIYTTFVLVGFLFSFTGIASVSLNLLEGGFGQFNRTLDLFWNKRPVSATMMASFLTFNMCIPAILLVPFKRMGLFHKIILLGIFIISILCAFRLGSRTQVAIFFATMIISLIIVIPRQSAKANFRLIAFLSISTLIILAWLPINPDADYLSVLGRRLQETDNNATAGNRTQRWAKSLDNLITKPFGWERMEFGYSHNLWLDVAQSTGLLPFILLVLFTFKSTLNTAKLVLIRNLNLSFRLLIAIYFLGAHLLFL